MAQLVGKWGFGGIVRWLEAIKLKPTSVAFMNMALCAVADDNYFPALFETCYERHTKSLLQALKPDVVLLCGKKQLAPYVARIEELGPKVILTWHYRPMHTTNGQSELQRVRRILRKLGA